METPPLASLTPESDFTPFMNAKVDPGIRNQALKDYVAFYPGRVDAAYLDDERVQAQPGDFYGGWITSDLDGPFKGPPGTSGW